MAVPPRVSFGGALEGPPRTNSINSPTPYGSPSAAGGGLAAAAAGGSSRRLLALTSKSSLGGASMARVLQVDPPGSGSGGRTASGSELMHTSVPPVPLLKTPRRPDEGGRILSTQSQRQEVLATPVAEMDAEFA